MENRRAGEAMVALCERMAKDPSAAVRREVAGRTVLVLGITEEEPRAAADATRALLDAPANATRDLVVVLTRGGRRTARAVAQVAGVHVVVLGGADVDEALPPGSAGGRSTSWGV